MKNRTIIPVTLLMALMLIVFIDLGQLFATLPENTATLFHIKRSRDADEVVLEANLDASGSLSKNQPVSVFWMRPTQDRRRAPLTWLQQRLAYGVEYSYVSEKMVVFNFVAYKRQSLILTRDASGYFRVFAELDGKRVMIDHIYVQFDGGTYFTPKISHVNIYGKEAGTNDLVVRVIRP